MRYRHTFSANGEYLRHNVSGYDSYNNLLERRVIVSNLKLGAVVTNAIAPKKGWRVVSDAEFEDSTNRLIEACKRATTNGKQYLKMLSNIGIPDIVQGTHRKEAI